MTEEEENIVNIANQINILKMRCNPRLLAPSTVRTSCQETNTSIVRRFQPPSQDGRIISLDVSRSIQVRSFNVVRVRISHTLHTRLYTGKHPWEFHSCSIIMIKSIHVCILSLAYRNLLTDSVRYTIVAYVFFP